MTTEQTKEYMKKYHEKNKEKRKKYYEDNKERIKKYRKNNKEKNKIYLKKYYEDNKEKIKEYAKEYSKEYRENNKDIVKEYNKEYYEYNKEKIKEYRKEYQKKYLQTENGKMVARRGRNKRRWNKRQTNDGSIPMVIKHPYTKELIDLLKRQNYKCYLCECDITKNKHWDHWIPISKGGDDTLANGVWLCPTCNMRKGATMPDKLLLV